MADRLVVELVGQDSLSPVVASATSKSSALSQQMARSMEADQVRLTAAIDREARKQADAEERELKRAMAAELKAFDDRLRMREQERQAAEKAAAAQASAAEKASATSLFGAQGPLASLAGTLGRGLVLGAGYQALQSIESGIEAIGTAAVGMNSKLEQARIGFTTMLGSAEKADAFLKEMAQFAAVTPFQFPELVAASQRMLAMGFAAEQIKPTLTAVGNAVAAMGTGKEGIDRVTLALGQMNAKTTVQAEEMRQLTEAGIPAWQMLADKLNTSVAEAMALVERRAVSASTFLDAFREGVATRYGDMMAVQARTFAGAMSTITDNAQMAIAQGFKPLFEILTDATVAFADFTQTKQWDDWATAIEQATARAAKGIKGVPTTAQVLGATINQQTGAGTGLEQAGQFLQGLQLPGGGQLTQTSQRPGTIGEALAGPLNAAAARLAEDQARMVGTDFVDNLVKAISDAAPKGADAFAAVVEGLVQDGMNRGMSEADARDWARAWFQDVLTAVEAARPDMTEAGQQIGEALADGLEAARPTVINVTERIANEIGSALQMAKGNVETAIGTVLTQEQGPAAEMATAQILQRANALKAVNEILNTLTPAERAHYEVMLLANGAADKTNQALGVLNQMRDAGKITQEQYTNAIDRGSVGLERHTTGIERSTTAAQAHTAAVQAETAAIEQQASAVARAGFSGGAYGGFRGETAAPGTGTSQSIEEAYAQAVNAATRREGGGTGYSGGGLGTTAEIQAMVANFPNRTYGGSMDDVAQMFEDARRYTQANAAAQGAEAEATKGATAATQGLSQTVAETQLTIAQLGVASGQASAAFLSHNEAVNNAAETAMALSTGMDFAQAAAARMAAGALAAGGSLQDAAAAAAQATAEFKVAAANSAALMAGQMRNAGVAGNVTATGLTYGQIYGGAQTLTSSASGGKVPSTVYGLPVVSPLTPGSLYGFADGGIVTSPTAALVGEAGPEAIIPLRQLGGGGDTFNVAINITVDGASPDVLTQLSKRGFWEQITDNHLRFIFRKRQLI